MLLSLPLRVHLLRCIEDREMTHAEVVDSSVMLRIWTVYRELGIKGFPVHWAPPIRVRCVICFVLCLLSLIFNQRVHLGWLLCVLVMVVLLGQKACQACPVHWAPPIRVRR